MAPMDVGQAAGLDDEKMNDLYEIFGNGEDYEWALEGEEEMENEEEDKAPELKDVFEPGELKARLLTDEDNIIRVEDIPERYQLLRQSCKMNYELEAAELLDEKNWINMKMNEEKGFWLKSRPNLVSHFDNAVKDVIDFIVNEALEVPFIWHNRKDYVCIHDSHGREERLLSEDDLWRIVDLDIEFHGLLEKKKAAEKIYDDIGVYSAVYDEAKGSAKTLVEFQDLMDFVQFQYSAQIKQRKQDGEVKRHSRFGRFERIRESNMYELVKAFGLSAEDLAENIEADHRLNFCDDKPQDPLELAEKYVDPQILDSGDEEKIKQKRQQVLEEAEQMLAEEIFYNPKLRSKVRELFWRSAKVDILLTDKGHKKIDPSSIYYPFKYAINRTFEELRIKPDLYLQMLQAELEGLVVVRISYPDYKTTLFEQMLRLFTSDGVSDIATQWNEARRQVFKTASRKVVPLICRNIKEDLKQDCMRSLFYSVRREFTRKVNQAPYRPPELALGEKARILSISAGMGDFGKDAVLAAMMDEDGQIVKTFKFDDDPRELEFKDRFVEAVEECQPDVLCMAGFTVNSANLYRILKQVVEERQLKSGTTNQVIELIWAQDEVARLYMNSQRSETEFPEHTQITRYCIALARYLQSPLLEYAALGDEINALHIHQHQSLLPKDVFQRAIGSVFVDWVNTIGVEINETLRSSYIANLLQYVSGLGPRKVSSLMEQLQARGGLAQREDLLMEKIMTSTIFINSASFLKISNETKSRSSETEMLDATRIHPEDYNDAKTIAKDAFDLDDEDVADLDSKGGIISYINQRKNDARARLRQLQLDKFAEKIEEESNGQKKKYSTLLMIREELVDPYKELRERLRRLSDMDVFTMLTGETVNTLAAGQVVPATIRKIGSRFMVVRLACGIDCNVPQDYLPMEKQSLQFGQTIPGVVLSLDYQNFTGDISLIAEHVEANSNPDQHVTEQDNRKWNVEAERRDKALARRKEDEENRRDGRVIQHQYFKPYNSKQAEEYLAQKDDGDVVIRPSSKGQDCIALTWRVGPHLFQHLAIDEIKPATAYEQGDYRIGKQQYYDLDHIIQNYVHKCVEKVREITANSKFSERKQKDIEELLRSHCESSGRSQYQLGWDFKRPGSFLLHYKLSPNAPVQSLQIKVTPDGFRLNGHDYADVTQVLNGFKRQMARASRQ